MTANASTMKEKRMSKSRDNIQVINSFVQEMPTDNIHRMSTNLYEARPVSQGARDPSPSILKSKGGGDGSKVTRKSSGVQWNLKENNPIKLNRYLSGSTNRRVKTSMLKPKIIEVEPYNDQHEHQQPLDETKQIDLFAYKTIENMDNSFEMLRNEGLEDKDTVMLAPYQQGEDTRNLLRFDDSIFNSKLSTIRRGKKRNHKASTSMDAGFASLDVAEKGSKYRDLMNNKLIS